MNKAIFLDRDGVINKEKGYITKIKDFELLDGVAKSLKILQDNGYKLIVVTNQGCIAKGLCTEKKVVKIHQYLKKLLEKKDVFLTDIYYCPHHHEISPCECRKPGTLMLEQAISKHHIDKSQSFLIGDHDRDVEAGQRLGLKTIKMETNGLLKDVLELITLKRS